jgi:DNA-binding FadR family transcriptional regulator
MQVVAALRGRTESREPKPGAPVPPEELLAQQFHVSRPVVRQAMMMHVNDGYVHRTAGKGTFVLDRPKPRIGGWLLESIDDVLAFGWGTEMNVLSLALQLHLHRAR